MFNKRLKDLRTSKNLTQSNFAKELNISSSTVAMWETGKREPDSDTMIKISKYFNVSTDYLLGNNAKEQPFINEKELEIIKAYKALDNEHKQIIEAMIHELLKLKQK